MAKVINPFIVTGKIEPEYFCDRVTESARLIKSVTNGNNLVIISPRRMGKTGLIQFCYDKPEIAAEYYTFFIDILHTSSLREFTYLLGREIYETLLPRSRKMADLFIQTIKSISGKFGFDPITGMPTFNVELGDIDRPEYTLDEIFQYLGHADKPCIVAIDEFQQIARYPEKNVEAVLRTHIQKCTNTTFVFAGSQRHMMQNIFFSASRPFYQSASFMNLGPIAEEAYRRFVQRHFRQAGKEISGECIERIYTLFEGHTWYMQSMLNRLYEQTAKGEGATLEEADIVLHQTVNAQQAMYQNMVAMLSERQKELLFAIGKEGRAREITSVDFVTRHGLYSSSSVQSAARQLLEKEFITKEENVYQVYDRFFGLWLAETYGTGYRL